MLNLLLSSSVCGSLGNGINISFAAIDQNGWVGINMLVVLVSVLVTAMIYAASRFLPTQRGERLRGIVKYEITEAFISLVIILILIGMSGFACTAGASLSQAANFQGLYKFDDYYVGTLLFHQGVGIMTQLYTTTMEYVVTSNIAVALGGHIGKYLGSTLLTNDLFQVKVELAASNLADLYQTYSNEFSATYAGLVVAVFSLLLILYLALPIIQAVSLTVVAPAAMVMRSLAFTGPKLRETSNMFLAMAIGMYFVLPMTLASNYYMASCLGIINLGTPVTSCLRPEYQPYLSPQTLDLQANVVASMFQSNTVNLNTGALSIGMPSVQTNLFSITSGGAASGWGMFALVFNAPDVALHYGNLIAEYVFVGIVLIAVDMMITVGFMAGLTKGLNAISELMSTGPFWG